MKKMIYAVMGCVFFLGAQSFGTTWDIDGAHSTAGFKVRHMMVSWVKGSFKDIKGTVEADDKDVTKFKTEATIAAASIDTGVAKRDEHLKSADFFDTGKFKTITFKSTGVTKKDGEKFQIHGDLTMHGVTKPITLDVEEFAAPHKDMQGTMRRGLSATGKINRKDFGLAWNKALEAGGVAVGEEVFLALEVELTPQLKAETKTKSKKS